MPRSDRSHTHVDLGTVFPIENRKVLITGAASGLGRAVALNFAHLGANVIALDLDDGGLQTLEVECEAARGSVRVIPCDVGDAAAVEESLQKACAGQKDLDAVLHIAGIAGPLLPITDLSESEWNRVIQTNLTSAFLIARTCVPYFRPHAIGKIVLTTSTWGVVGSRRVPVSAYAASKAGIVGLGAQLAMELAPSINVNTIVPAGIRSAIAGGFYDDPDAVAALTQDLPTDCIREAETIVGLCLLLSTSASDHITGAVVPIDGGYLAY